MFFIKKYNILTVSFALGVLLISVVATGKINSINQKVKVDEKITQSQKPVKYAKKSASQNDIENVIKNNLKSNNDWISQLNKNKDCYILVTPDNNNFYQTTKGIPDSKTFNSIINELKSTGKPVYAISNNSINSVCEQVHNQQEKQMLSSVSPFMLLYLSSKNGETTATNLLSAVDTSRKIVLQNTKQWINTTNK